MKDVEHWMAPLFRVSPRGFPTAERDVCNSRVLV